MSILPEPFLPSPELVDYVPSMQLSEAPSPLLSDAELVAAVAAVQGRVFVGLKPRSAQRSRETGRTPAISKAQYLEGRVAVEQLGVRVTRTYRNFPFVEAVLDPELAPEIRRLEAVDHVRPVAIYRPLSPVGRSRPLSLLMSETQDWGLQKVGAHHVWAAEGNHGDSAQVTLIDSGVDSVHMLFGGDGPVHSSGMCAMTYAAGYIESCYHEPDIVHGSLVGGILGAAMNGSGYVGISPNVKYFRSFRVCYFDYQYYNDIVCHASYIAAVLDWLVTYGGSREIVNISLGGPHDDDLYQAIVGSYNAGHLIVAAAGNNVTNHVNFPAKYSEVVAVSGTTTTDAFAGPSTCPYHSGYSTYGAQVELSAPFWAINMGYGGGDYWDCGTSMATPVVSGVAALVWTKYPNYTRNQVRSRLTATAIDLGASGHDSYFGYGRVDARRAVYGVLAVSLQGPDWVGGGVETWTADVSNGFNNTYAWQRWDCSGWSSVGTNSSTYQEMTTPGDEFLLRVTVTSVGRQEFDTKLVGGIPWC